MEVIEERDEIHPLYFIVDGKGLYALSTERWGCISMRRWSR